MKTMTMINNGKHEQDMVHATGLMILIPSPVLFFEASTVNKN